MLESAEQRILVRWMESKGFFFFSVPNEAASSAKKTNQLKKMGLSPGAPDLVIVTRPPARKACVVCIELKRAKGGRVSTVQKAWHNPAEANGFIVYVCYGAKDAIPKLCLLYGLVP